MGKIFLKCFASQPLMQLHSVPLNFHEIVKMTRRVKILGCLWQLDLTLNSNWFSISTTRLPLKPDYLTIWPKSNGTHVMTLKLPTPSIFTFRWHHLFSFSILECCSFCSKLELTPRTQCQATKNQVKIWILIIDWDQDDILRIMARWRFSGDPDDVDEENEWYVW